MKLPLLYSYEKIKRDEYLVLDNVIYKFGNKNPQKSRNFFFCYGEHFPVISSQNVADLEREYFQQNKEFILNGMEQSKSEYDRRIDSSSLEAGISSIVHFELFKTFIERVTPLYQSKLRQDIRTCETNGHKKEEKNKNLPNVEEYYNSTFLGLAGEKPLGEYPNLIKFDNNFYSVIPGDDRDFFFRIHEKNYVIGAEFTELDKLASKTQEAIEEKISRFLQSFSQRCKELEQDQQILGYAKRGRYEHETLKIGIQKRDDGQGFFVYFHRDKPYALVDVGSKDNVYVFPPAHIGFFLDNKHQVEWNSDSPYIVKEPYIHPALLGDDLTAGKTFCVGEVWQRISLPLIKSEKEPEDQFAKLLFWARYFLLESYNEGATPYKHLGTDNRYNRFGPKKRDEIKGIEITNGRI